MWFTSDNFTPNSNEGANRRFAYYPLVYIRRMKYMMRTKDGVYTVKQAARKLRLSTRWLKHLKKRFNPFRQGI
jgi:hypothetical protein